jgi:hypothetical protein
LVGIDQINKKSINLEGTVANGQAGNGMNNVWAGNGSEGSQLIIDAVTKEGNTR